MNIQDIALPEIYKSSMDFRFFLRWFTYLFSKIQYDTDNTINLYDPLKCPSWLLWMLGDTMGFKYDDRLPAAFNRLVLVYFMSMIRNRGSKDGVTLAAEVNLAQFNILEYGQEDDILYNRLEDTAIPVNSAYVTPHTAEGYIDVVYFSEELPVDACIEYVRPLGMYIFQEAGVRFDARSKIVLDARLTNENDIGISIGPTHVGHYSREDYARMQRTRADLHKRDYVWYRNSDYEGDPAKDPIDKHINPGQRTLYSLQLCNNEHIVKSLLPSQQDERIFGLGYPPTFDVEVNYGSVDPDDYILPDEDNSYVDYNIPGSVVQLEVKDPDGNKKYINAWNLRYDKKREYAADGISFDTEDLTPRPDVYTVDSIEVDTESIDHTDGRTDITPAVNPVMMAVGDPMARDEED